MPRQPYSAAVKSDEEERLHPLPFWKGRGLGSELRTPSSQEGDRGVEKFMIPTRIEPPLLTGSFDTVVTVDTKANMLMAANIWGYDLPKSWRKDEIARSMAYGHL